ncbi:MAG: protein phosphatase [Gemmatimonadetes bacterium]|nr:serine/threonine-protein phosphatase [Gemmatimonadota bacterium]NIQ54141.1 serine/threonine-protein phosphatase [Gemmatimonadota bacterium]NIU74340.1 protein phosphatase [Gammaproteobacteria bacterium]NIX43992.1 protein phosphatase [Gemmatimonadota bacterium]NIY08565.1 protein phosphatase [Gemmatimonadota bacterium]
MLRPDRGLFAVADGMGGHAAGDIASRIAVDVLDERTTGLGSDAEERLRDSLSAGHEAILKAARADPALQGMGTTLTVLHAAPVGCVIAHVGDSRAYRWRDGALEQLTRDQTWVQEQVDAGLLAPERARDHPFSAMLTCALGIEEVELDVQLLSPPCETGDTYLLCSDGLTARLDDHDLRQVLLEHDDDLDTAADALVEAANQAGGPDNITVALVRLDSTE